MRGTAAPGAQPRAGRAPHPCREKGSGPAWEMEAGLWPCWEWEKLRCLSVLQRDISQGRPSAGWLCESGPQTAWFHKSSAVLLAALPKWFGRNKTQIVGRQSTGTGGSWRAESKRSLCSVSFAHHRGLLNHCSEGFKMCPATGLQVHCGCVCAGNVLSLIFLHARIQILNNKHSAQRKGNHSGKICF